MKPHAPPQLRVALLLTCPACHGSEYVSDSATTCVCRACASGYLSVALPLRAVLDAGALPEAEQYPALLALAQQTGHVQHPLLYQSGVGVPPHYCPPLKMSKGDEAVLARRPEMGGIPLVPRPE